MNLNAFVARLTANSSHGDSRDFSLYGIWALRDALEDSDPKEKLPNKSLIQAACMWIIYAGPRLEHQVRENRAFDGKSAREGHTLVGKGWTGFSTARWKIWHERLIHARNECEDESTKDLLSRAISAM